MQQKSKKGLFKKVMKPVDCSNDQEMQDLCGRYRNLQPRDPSVWTKTPNEKEKMKQLRRIYGRGFDSCSTIKKNNRSYPGRLTIYVKGMNQSTYSIKCNSDEVNRIVSNYGKWATKVVKYHFV